MLKSDPFQADRFMRLIKRFVVCKIIGHRSTGTLLWWMCDRCHADFENVALPSEYVGSVKITHS